MLCSLQVPQAQCEYAEWFIPPAVTVIKFQEVQDILGSSGETLYIWKVSSWQSQWQTFPKVAKGIIFLSAVCSHPIDFTIRVIALKLKSDIVIP